MPFSFWRSFLSRYSSTVASLAVLWPKEIMCCSWRWVVVAPNPKDFGLFLAQEVLMMQPKMEMSSHLREPEVSREQHPLCLPGEGKYYLFLLFHALLLHFLYDWFDCGTQLKITKMYLNILPIWHQCEISNLLFKIMLRHSILKNKKTFVCFDTWRYVYILQLDVLWWGRWLGPRVLWRDNCDKKWKEKSQAEKDSEKLITSGEVILLPAIWFSTLSARSLNDSTCVFFLSMQGIIKLDHPCIHVDFPVVLCEVWCLTGTVHYVDSVQ